MLHINGAATPISDLSDRDAMFSAGSALTGTTGLYVFCSMFFLLFLFMMVSLSLLSIYCCMSTFSDTT
jgi:hypothetical protein